MRHRLHALAVSLLALPFLLLSACGGGGGGGGGGSDAGGTGAASIFLTDAPVQAHDFDEILVTLESIELLGDDGPVTIFSGMEVVDLTDLEDFSDLFVYADEVPVGVYRKIRMRVTRIELVRDGESFLVEPPANGKLDLLPRDEFRIREGITLVIEIDMDANKSIHIVRRGHRDVFNFRPVVRVTVRETVSPDKLTRVHGEVTELFDGGFELCSTVFLASRLEQSDDDHPDGGIGDRHRCLDVETDMDTGVFDSNGDPVDPGFLMVGDEVTVIGRIHVLDGNHDDQMEDGGAGAGHEEHHQSFGDGDSDSGDSDSADSEDSDDADSGDSDSADSADSDSEGDDDLPPDLILLAYVIEIGPPGTFLRLDGLVQTEPVMDRFDFRVDPGQGFGEDSVLSVLLQAGTRIFSRSGNELDESEILPGTRGLVDGVLSTDATETLLKSALVVLDIGVDDAEVLRGSILSLNPTTRRLVLDPGDGPQCVHLAEDAYLFLVREGDEGSTSERVDIEALYPGLRADVYGMFVAGSDCFEAGSLIGFPVECATRADCEVGLFCAKEEGMCDAAGVCQTTPSVCTDIFQPVCGCDDLTYGNACEASAAGVAVASPGACEGGGPVGCGGESGTSCPDGQACEIEAGMCDPAAQGSCVDVPAVCPGVVEPVCGCDGTTYANACLALKAGATVASEGLCEGSGECGGILASVCGEGEVCLRSSRTCDPLAIGRCIQEPAVCPDLYDPVCGCDGTTYGNACLATKAGAAISFAGACEGRVACGGMDTLSCFEGETCLKAVGDCREMDEGICVPTPEACPLVSDPVCGCDGETYDNGCFALAMGVGVRALGACDDAPVVCGGVDDVECAEGELCLVEGEGACAADAEGVCVPRPAACIDLFDPVCGCDGLTYPNACRAAEAGVRVDGDGPCAVPAS